MRTEEREGYPLPGVGRDAQVGGVAADVAVAVERCVDPRRG